MDEDTLRQIIGRYQKPDLKRSIWQIINTVSFYIISWYLMYLSLNISIWWTLALAFPSAGLMIRLFIIFHDCGHGSFFISPKLNHRWGTILGILVFTPYYKWRHEHAIHHATSGNLDKANIGSIWTLTVDEYLVSSTRKKFKYRIYRNPFILLTIGSIVNFLFLQRFNKKENTAKDRNSTYFNTIFIIVMGVLLSLIMGPIEYLIIQFSILVIASIFGVSLFYLQHQFEEVYWARDKNWNRLDAALRGSSYFKLPKILQWFTGNIGFHHIHHLNSRIPNYFLSKCHSENPALQNIKTLTLLSCLKSFKLKLYDESLGKMVGYPNKKLKNSHNVMKKSKDT